MCIDKDKFEELAKAVSDVKADTSDIRQTQEAFGDSLAGVETHLKKLNSRTAKSERRLDNVEDDEYRTVRCVQREVINTIHQNMLTVDKFEEWERKKEEDRIRAEDELARQETLIAQRVENRQRKNSWIVTAIVGAGTIAMALIGYLS